MTAPWMAKAAFLLLILGLVLAFLRLLRGPSAPDRFVALDLIALLLAGVIAVVAVSSGEPVFLDAVGVLALVAFIGTVTIARYLEDRR